MMEPKKICIVGFGLIGGSLGKAIKRHTDYAVFAIDRDPEVLAFAIAQKATDKTGGIELLTDSDIVFIALSPSQTKEFLLENAGKMKKGAIVTDVCGVKSGIVLTLEKLCEKNGLFFIGGHPMAGKECNGFTNSDSELFLGASYVLTPTVRTPPEVTAFMMEFAAKIGCTTATVTSAENHDKMIAFTSQLPHVLAGSYIKSSTSKDHKGYSAGSFRDVSRVATIDEDLWCELFLENKENLCEEINRLINHLSEYKAAIETKNAEKLKSLIRKGKEIKVSLKN